MVYLINHEICQRSLSLKIKMCNLEDSREEREMIGSIFLKRRSAKQREALTRMDLGRLRTFNPDIVSLKGKINKIWTNLEEV